MATVERILIVGGGIAGLTLANALHQQGFSPELVERSPEWPAIGAGIMLQANGLRVLRALGLAAAVEQVGAVVRHWAWCDQQGEVLSDTDLVGVWGGVGPCVGIARPALQQVLLMGAAAVPYRLGTAVTSLTQEEQNQCVQVGFSDGSSGEYDLVVGADGLGSTVRELALGTASIGYTGVMMWRSMIPTRPPEVTDTLTILLGEGSLFGQVPMGAGHTYGFGYVNEPRLHDPLEGRRERLRQRFAAFGGPVPTYLAALTHDEQIHCATHRVGAGHGAVAPRPCGAHRRCGPCRSAHDGHCRLHGDGGRLRAGRGATRGRNCGERPGYVRAPLPAAR